MASWMNQQTREKIHTHSGIRRYSPRATPSTAPPSRVPMGHTHARMVERVRAREAPPSSRVPGREL
jgi:hypothetical protein